MLYNDKELAAMLAEVKTIAVIGAVDKPGRPVDGVGREMIDMGFDVIPVHPIRKDVWGLETYASVKDIDRPVDVVDLFRNAQFCPDHAREVLAMEHKPKCFWMQSGIISPEAREILADSGIVVIEDRCLKVELQRFGITR
ncbi:CoA-binding domain protein [Pseudodesulfovibrio profundus]|uniref:CoA-binding domain protein n=1 Tax=Pseudodesulfovibrio profundus TaxID=57320 RepID=A0A2C8F3I8_9BACT|nr:CoA-binding protein [Pseudodesulfovibrio profundus]SOB57101.1 CoA-binding domain protein [Pseudodesulfovibrio profundus]|tara:strand:+ start:180 stop:599 length:420 start_codon:yes stop_codon:yes gene_type:complete